MINHAQKHEEFEKFLVMMDDLDQKIKSTEPHEFKAKIVLAEAGKMEAALAPSFPVTIELIPVLYQVFLKAANRYKAVIDFMTGVESDACEN